MPPSRFGADWPLPPAITFFDVLTNDGARISWGEIGLSALVAILLGALVAAIGNHHLLYRTAGRLGISRKFGDPDVWSYFLNSPDTLWVAVRDVASDTVSEGAVEAFSDTGDTPELLPRTVKVSRHSTDTELYECDRAYLPGDRGSLIVEQIRGDTGTSDEAPPLRPGNFSKGGRDLGPAGPRPERPPAAGGPTRPGDASPSAAPAAEP